MHLRWTILIMLSVGCVGQIDDAGADAGDFDIGRPFDAGPRDAVVPDVDVEGCTSASGFFEHYLWPEVLEAVCIDCHTEGGDASEGFVLVPAFGNDDYLERNFAVVRGLAEEAATDTDLSLLEAKPTASVRHGGGAPAAFGGRLHGIIHAFVERVEALEGGPDIPNDCMPEDTCEGIVLAAPVATLRRLAITFLGRLPTESELSQVREGGVEALGDVVDDMFDEPAFVQRVVEGFSDLLLVEGQEHIGGGLLSYPNFPLRAWSENDSHPAPPVPVDPDDQYRISRDYDLALRSEASALVRYIVEEDRSFEEVLTANYAMVSPYTARGYGIFQDMAADSAFADPNDPFEFVPVRMPARTNRAGERQETPDGFYTHAGVLTTPAWLGRHQSTDTNRNRGRVRAFYMQFLGVDILSLALPADAASAMSTAGIPTMESPACVGCHSLMDPIAGLFQHFDNRGNFNVERVPHRQDEGELQNRDEWFTDMFGPGFHGEDFPADEEWRALPWLAERTVRDPRFAQAMASHALYILTQTPTVRPPIDREDPLYRPRLNGYKHRRDAIEVAGQALIDSGFNIKAAFRSLVLSDVYRTESYAGERSPECLTELDSAGFWSVLTPEQLNRKIESIFGARVPRLDPSAEVYVRAGLFHRSPSNENWYRIYGGIDRNAVTVRQTSPNTVMGAIMRANAENIPCELVPDALSGGAPDVFIPGMDMSADAATIRQNIEYLHERILGQEVGPDDSDIGRSVVLFNALRDGGAARVSAGEEGVRSECGEADDPTYTERAWIAYVGYLLRRPEFLLQ